MLSTRHSVWTRQKAPGRSVLRAGTFRARWTGPWLSLIRASDICMRIYCVALHAAHAHLGHQGASSQSDGGGHRLRRPALLRTQRQQNLALEARGPVSHARPDQARRPAASPQTPAALAWGSAVPPWQPQLWAMGGTLRSVHIGEYALLALSCSRLAMCFSKVTAGALALS